MKLPIAPDAPWLAPLAGFSDLPFRLLCREQGAAVACTEMVSAKGLVYGLRRKKGEESATEDLLSTTVDDQPLVVQLFCAEAEFAAEAVKILKDRGFCFFDLNMGCSVPKVTKTGAGSAMLKDVPNALRVAEAMIREAGEGRAGFKLRLGWETGSEVYRDLALALQEAGAAWVTLHPRSARQAFGGSAQWPALRVLSETLTIPVIASGDLFTAADAAACVAQTGVSGVMFARGAIHNPAVFAAYGRAMQRGESGAISQVSEPEHLDGQALLSLIHRHAELARTLTPGRPGRNGAPPALLKMRTVVPRYVRHLPGAKGLRHSLSTCQSWEGLFAVLDEFF